MNSDDKEHQPLSPPPYHHHHRRRRHRLTELMDSTVKTLSQPKLYIILFLLAASFYLGYLSRNPNPTPLLPYPTPAASQLSTNVSEPTACNCNSPPAENKSEQVRNDADAAAEAHYSFPEVCQNPIPTSSLRRAILERVFNSVSPWTGFPPAHAQPLLEKDFRSGWGSTNAVFEHLLTEVRPKTIIEVGTYLGASAIHMANLGRKLGLEEMQILCIDDFRGWPGYWTEGRQFKQVNGDSMLLYQFMQNVVMANASDIILFLPFATTTALEGLCNWGVYGDLVEIDAAHDFHSAWVDINKGYKVLRRPGGVLFGHDYAWPGVRKAVHLFARLNGFKIKLDEEHWILY